MLLDLLAAMECRQCVRIESFSCSNKAVEEKFWQDLAEVYVMYGVEKAGEA